MSNGITYHCEECDWHGMENQMGWIENIHERVCTGELMPAGQCPECGALIGVDDGDIPDYTLEHCAKVLERRKKAVMENNQAILFGKEE